MAHKHHPTEARIRAVQPHDGGRPASEICMEMNISPATLKRWLDQLHMLASPYAAKMQEQEKTIEHMAASWPSRPSRSASSRWPRKNADALGVSKPGTNI